MRSSLARSRRVRQESRKHTILAADIGTCLIYNELTVFYNAFDAAKAAFRMDILAGGRDRQCGSAKELKTDDLDIVVLENKE